MRTAGPFDSICIHLEVPVYRINLIADVALCLMSTSSFWCSTDNACKYLMKYLFSFF